MNIIGIDKFIQKKKAQELEDALDKIVGKVNQIRDNLKRADDYMSQDYLCELAYEVSDIVDGKSKMIFLIHSLANFFVLMSQELLALDCLNYENLSALMCEVNKEISNTILMCENTKDVLTDKLEF